MNVRSLLKSHADSKMVLRFCMASVCGILIGICLFGMLASPYWKSLEQATLTHFELPFHFVKSMWEGVWLVARYAIRDIGLVWVLFLPLFTRIPILLMQPILILRGIQLGFFTALLRRLYTESTFVPSILKCLAFFIVHGVLLLCLILHAIQGVHIYAEISEPGSNRRLSLSKRAFKKAFLQSLTVSLVCFLLYGIYFVVIFLL